MNIQPLTIWVNGQNETATQLIVNSIYDNLQTYAKFYWQILDANDNVLQFGNTTMDGTTYQNWGSSQDINLAAYQWNAQQLGLTLN